MEYRIIVSELTTKLSDFVNRLIQEGWEPQGGIAINASGMLYQAMVKHGRPEITSEMVEVSNKKTSDVHRIGSTMGKNTADCISDPVKHRIHFDKLVEELPKVVRG